jgi:hypothetical protein
MPTIISIPAARTRKGGVTPGEVQEYLTLLESVEVGEGVVVDDSERPTYEQAYARGERIRLAARKHGMDDQFKIIGVEQEDGTFVAVICHKA